MIKNKTAATFVNGLITENPTFVQLLGMCPTLAVSTTVENAIGMGISTTAILMCSNALISALRKAIPDKVRIAAYVVIIAGFVSMLEMVMRAYFPALEAQLGIFIPLIVVNCIVFARAESFASKNNVGLSLVDGLATGMGFTCALAIVALVREFLGFGTMLGIQVIPEGYAMTAIVLPPGGFIVLGLVIGMIQLIVRSVKNKKQKGGNS